jgi:tetratricopeptide (TPR) repeat protein
VFLEVFFLAMAGMMLFSNLETHSRLQRINRALEDGRPYDFLRDIDLELERPHKGALRELLKLNRSAGLVYIGEFDEALVYLKSVDRDVLGKGWLGRQKKFTDALYYNNLLYTLLCARRYSEAVEVWSESAEKIVPRTGHGLLDHCLKGTAATYQYHCGDLPNARESLERLLQEPNIPRLYKAHRLYYLGRIDLFEGRFELAMGRIEEAAKLAPGGFLAEEPKRLVLGEERIPNPGAGRALPTSGK